MRLFLFCLALSSSAVVGALGNIVDIEASIEIPQENIESLVANPDGQFRGYKILNEINGTIYIGGRETLIMYNAIMYNATTNTPEYTFPAYSESNQQVTCEQLIGSENSEKICQNYIRLAEQIENDLLVCGTNKQNPRCHLVNVSTGAVKADFAADRKTQRSVTQNTTARFHDGNLYAGFSEGTQPNPSHISKFMLEVDGLSEVAETDDQNPNLVNEPQFVGKPYVTDKFMYFFYRETAVEAVNQGKFVYSRVARICLNDDGTNGNFEIFVKARLNCSLQGDYPFYFNHIQDVTVEEKEDDTVFYAVFTTTPHGPSSSAVCAYKLSDIDATFDTSKFKGKVSGKLPGPVNRPDYANKFTSCDRLTNAERNFLKTNPLMDDLVPNWNAVNPGNREGSDAPLFYSTSMNFYSIAVHSLKEENIYYVGTERGTIMKAYFRKDDGKYVFFEQEIWDAKSAVTGLRFDDDTQTLLVVTGEGLFRMDLEGCNADCERECVEFYYPYCTYDSGFCRASRSTETPMDNPNIDNSVNILCLPPGNPPIIKSCNSRKVELTCEVKSSTLCEDANLIWKKGEDVLVNCTGNNKCEGKNSSVGHLVMFREIVLKTHHKLIHLSVDVHKDKTEGDYTCLFDQKNSHKTVRIEVDHSKGCLTKALYMNRMEHRKDLEMEKDEMEKCSGDEQVVSSESVLFKTCNKCPGNPDINPEARWTT